MKPQTTLLIALALGLFIGASARAADKARIDAAVAELAKFNHGNARQAVAAVELLVRETHGQADLRDHLETRLAELLQSQAGDDAKLMACQQLWIIGPTKSAPALAKLLQDDTLSHAAAYATGNSASPQARAVLRDAAKTAKGRAACNVFNALGVTRDEDAIDVIMTRAADPEPAVAEAAIAALGRIGSPEAAAALARLRASAKDNRPIVLLASLNCAEGLAARNQPDKAAAIYIELMKPSESQMTRRGALAGLISLGGDAAMSATIAAMKGNEPMLAGAAIAAVRKLPGEQVTVQLAQVLPTLDPDVQAILIEALAGRGGEPAKKAVEQSLANEHAAVRLAAIRSLGKAGDAASVELLLKSARSDEEKRAALASLGQLSGGQQTDAAIQNSLAGADPALRAGLIKVLGDRRAATAVPELLKLAGDADPAIARAALDALGNLAGAEHLGQLLAIVQTTKDDAARRAAEQAGVSVALRIPDADKRADAVIEAFKSAAAPEAKSALARVLGGIATAKAADVLKEAAKEGDPAVRDSALRALAAWPDTSVTPFLLNAARLTDANNLRRALAIRGALRQMADATAKSPQAPAALIEWFVKAEQLVRGPDEKRLLVSGLANLRHAEAIRLVKGYIEDPEVPAEAQLAAVQIAENLKDSNKPEARELVVKIRDITKDNTIKTKAVRVLRLIDAK